MQRRVSMDIDSADILSIALKKIFHNLCLSREMICQSGSSWVVELFEKSMLLNFRRTVKYKSLFMD